MLETSFRAAPLSGVGIVVALLLATFLAALAVRTGWAAGLRVWIFVAASGSFAAVTMLSGTVDRGWRWHNPFDVDLVQPDWGAFAGGISESTLNVWIGVPVGIGAALLALDVRRWWPVLVVLPAPWVAEWWQAVTPTSRHGLSGADLANNLYGIVVGLAVGFLAHVVLVWVERRTGAEQPRA